MRTIRRTIMLVVATSLFAGVAVAQGVQDRDRVRDPATHLSEPDRPFADRDRDRAYLRLRDRIKLDARLTAAQLRDLERELWRYHTRRGDHVRLRTLAQETTRSNCGPDCFLHSLRRVNQAMQQGASDREAVAMYRDALRAQTRARDRVRAPKLDARQLQARIHQDFDNRLTTWQQERERERQARGPAAGDQERDRLRDQERDRLRDQERDRLRDQERDRMRDQERDRSRDRITR